MNTKELLIAAKAKIENPENWCRWTMHRKLQDGKEQFCAIGALVYSVPCGEARVAYRAAFDSLQLAAYDLFSKPPPYVNDKNGHAAVMQMYNKAIESAS